MRLARALAAALFLAGVGALGVSASQFNTPTITGVAPWVVTPNGDLTVTGSDFSNHTTGSCDSIGGTPTVFFTPLDGAAEQSAQPANPSDGSQCSDSSVKVKVPGPLTGAAKISVQDAQGHRSNTSGSGFLPTVTVQPTGSVNPSAGPIGTQVSVQGQNLKPATVAPNSGFQLTIGGSPRSVNWQPNAINFDPANASGPVAVDFNVFTDSNNPGGGTAHIHINAGSYAFQPPGLDAASFAHQQVGSRLTMTGHDLGGSGHVTFAGGASGQQVSWRTDSINVTVPPGAQDGAIQVFPDGYNGAVPGPTIGLDPKQTGMSPATGSAGGQATITGFNFGDAQGSVSAGGAPEDIVSWGDQRVVFGITHDTDSGLVILTRADGAAVPVSSLSVVPHLDRLEGNNLPAGSQVVVDGLSLGAAQGKAGVGGTTAATLLWSRDSVLLQLPTSLAPGSYPVVLTTSAGAASNTLTLTIVPGPTPKAAAATSGTVAPSFDNNHDFVKPIKPPSAVFFNVTLNPHKVKAGDTADIVVTLKLNDRPVTGAAVKLAMLFTPGNDYLFTPDSGVTDANGVFTATVRVSKNAGDSIIAATSGVFSDQDHVAGTGSTGRAVATPTSSNPAAGGGFAPLLLLGVAALVLVAAGFYLNMRSMGH